MRRTLITMIALTAVAGGAMAGSGVALAAPLGTAPQIEGAVLQPVQYGGYGYHNEWRRREWERRHAWHRWHHWHRGF